MLEDLSAIILGNGLTDPRNLELEALSTPHLLDMVRCQPYQSLHVQLTEFLGISAYTPSFVWVVNVN